MDTQKLLKVEQGFDEHWGQRSVEGLSDCLHPDIVLHADGFIFDEDVRGIEKVVEAQKKFMDKHEYKHQHILRAASVQTKSVFGLWQDSDVKLLAGGEGQGPDKVACIWKLVVDEGGKVTDIWFLRQMTSAESQHRMKDPSKCRCVGLEAGGLPLEDYMEMHPKLEPSDERTQAFEAAAEKYSDAWCTGQAQVLGDMMKGDVCCVDLMHGEMSKGLDKFQETIKKVQEGWKGMEMSLDVAVTPDSNKAFIHWSHKGKVVESGEEATLYGLNVLVFDETDRKIKGTAGFRQLFPNERKELLKAAPFSAKER